MKPKPEAIKRVWDEFTDKVTYEDDGWASSDRGWYWEISADKEFPKDFRSGAGHPIGVEYILPLGNYLDYGPGHYRSGHDDCRPVELCRECQPGNVHAVVLNRYGKVFAHGYSETVAQARAWMEEQIRLKDGG